MEEELEKIINSIADPVTPFDRETNKQAVNAIMEVISKEQTRVFMEQVVHLDKMIKELKEWAKNYTKRLDGINKSDLLSKLNEIYREIDS